MKQRLFFVLSILYFCTFTLFSFEDENDYHPSYLQNLQKQFSFKNEEQILSSPLTSFMNFKKATKNYIFGKNPTDYFFHYAGKDTLGSLTINASLFAGYDFQFHNNESFNFVHKGLALKGNYQLAKSNLAFDANWTSGHFTGDRDFIDQNALILNGFYKNSIDDSYIYFDELTAKIQYNIAHHKVAIGRNSFALEDNISSSVILNDNVPKYGYFSYQFQWKQFNLDFLHGSLVADSLDTIHTYKDYDDRYFSFHKLSYESKLKKFYAYIGENIIYGSRNLDLSYWLPHTFYRVSEHRQGDRDNVLIFGGWRILYSNVKLYQNVVLDELRKSELFGNWWGNKYAVQTGISFQYKIPFTFEFTAIRPWLYTHKYHLNRYSHFGDPLGFSLGSNLIHYAFETKNILPFQIENNIRLSYTRQGSVGNSYQINYQDRLSDSAPWLDGDISDTFRTDFSIERTLFSRHSIKLTYHYEKELDNNENNYLYCSFLTRY